MKLLFFTWANLLLNLAFAQSADVQFEFQSRFGKKNDLWDIYINGVYLQSSSSPDSKYILKFNSDNQQYTFDSLPYGNYTLVHWLNNHQYSSDPFDISVSFYSRVDTVPYCQNKINDGICPKCKLKDKALVISPYTILDEWFYKKSDERRHYRKLQRQGYQIHDNTVIWVKSKILNDQFRDPCNRWMCIRDMVIF